MRVVVPYAAERPKTRLADALDDDERGAFSRAMRDDVLDAVRAAGGDPLVVATAETDCEAPVEVDDRPLTAAVNDRLAAVGDGRDELAVVMADLALADARSLSRFFGADGDVVVAPGLGGGTNALVVRHEDFETDYHGASYLDHRRIAREVGATVRAVDSRRLATDVDERRDLAEVLIHGDGRSRAFLDEAGFRLERSGGRVRAVRE